MTVFCSVTGSDKFLQLFLKFINTRNLKIQNTIQLTLEIEQRCNDSLHSCIALALLTFPITLTRSKYYRLQNRTALYRNTLAHKYIVSHFTLTVSVLFV